MPKLALNSFISRHKTGACVNLHFPEYRPGLVEGATGKVLPTPGRVTSELCKRLAGDAGLKSEAAGKVQQSVVADPATAQALIAKLACGRPEQGGSAPHCRASVGCTISMAAHIDLARQLGLFWTRRFGHGSAYALEGRWNTPDRERGSRTPPCSLPPLAPHALAVARLRRQPRRDQPGP